MTNNEQEQICRAIAVSCMWGQGGIASVILERFDQNGPKMPTSWREVYLSVSKEATRQYMGVITEEKELKSFLSNGYTLENHNEDGCSLFYPSRSGGGLAKYVSKELADKYPRPPAYTSTATWWPTLVPGLTR